MEMKNLDVCSAARHKTEEERSAALERLEDAYDHAEYVEAMVDYQDDPKTYSLEEVENELGCC